MHLTPGGVSCQVQRRCASASQASRPQPTTGSSSPAFPILPPDCCSCGTQPQAPHASEGFANLWQRPPHTKFSFPICTIQRHLMNPRCCSAIITISFQNISISPKGNLVPMAASPFPLVLNPGNHQSAFGLPRSDYSGISQKRNGTVCSLWRSPSLPESQVLTVHARCSTCQNGSPLCGWIVFRAMETPQPVHPFLCWWTRVVSTSWSCK